ncbi:Gfo/Idh/MocA family protein [Devosia sp. SL43]|uniref:Gfo/Idh/MocA family protein n=1 Tax=Devosia sp. SL43 TaxID=2806348 RepID=UPI001F3733C5|nr:Gfo/Idh/MocA family oxidoreductase [Devosia sp. SL43]UJW84679.1 Gfo/Idh/MocA family oxidoreductase [Devosia sp. SL43]
MRLLILGTGGMANAHADNFSKIDGVSLVGGVDVDPARLAEFCATHGIERQFASLEDALAWGEFDAVANVTPDRIHHPTTMQAIAAGKHVFCEKPLATNAIKAMEMTEAIEASGKVGMVNLTYRNSPAVQKGRELVLSGAIGKVRHVEASHLQSWLVGNHWGDWHTETKFLWRLSTGHGSNGALGDIGIHIVDFASYGSGLDVAKVFGRLRTFDKAPDNRIGEYTLDANDSFTMNVDFTSGAIGTIQATRTAAGQMDQLRLRVYGETGSVEMIYDTGTSTLRACTGEDVHAAKWHDVPFDPVETNYQRFVAAVRAGKTQEPSFRRAAQIQKVLDAAMASNASGRDALV